MSLGLSAVRPEMSARRLLVVDGKSDKLVRNCTPCAASVAVLYAVNSGPPGPVAPIYVQSREERELEL
jgi:hypothetical protein